MCGICGVVGRDRVDRDVLTRMTRTLVHRGPDNDGFYMNELEDGVTIGLGFRRLSIIDLTSGDQPIANEDGSLRLVLNGEIYNFRELRRDLEVRGHHFATNSDAEVVVHLYEEIGPDCVSRLNGMFAFALWDEPRQQLLLARDRFGKKPLYYADLGDALLFGSELKALLEHPRCPCNLDLDSLGRYLALEYVPTPHSIFEGVHKLPGGHTLRWKDGRTTLERYWELSFEAYSRLSDDELADQLRERLRESVRRRLVSDVPLGAFLSGGVDSSSIVAMMADGLPAHEVRTFSIGFRERSFDESDHARRVAQCLGTEHHEEVFTSNVMIDALPSLVEVLDEPFADASVLPTYVLSRFARQSVTVALGGDGADELLAGYPTFSAERIARLYRMPRVLHDHVVANLVDRLPVSTDNFSADFKLKRFVRAANEPASIRHPLWLGAFSPREQQELLVGPAGDAYDEVRQAFANAPTTDPINRLVYSYARTYLQDDILVKVDRASMATSLEIRAPFLDVELADFLGRVPPRLKLRRFDTKHLLKRAMRGVLPPGIADRPKKGFGIPIAAWFKGELLAHLQEELSAERVRRQGLFDAPTVGRLVSEHVSGRRDNRKQLWTLFVFQLWHRRWVESRLTTTAVTS
jgi:asparagine synthase (glutamine-hydrolysing)